MINIATGNVLFFYKNILRLDNHYKTYIIPTILLNEIEVDFILIKLMHQKMNHIQIKIACQFPSAGGSDHGLGTNVNRKSARKSEELNPSSAN